MSFGCRDDFRKTFKSANPDCKSVSLVCRSNLRLSRIYLHQTPLLTVDGLRKLIGGQGRWRKMEVDDG